MTQTQILQKRGAYSVRLAELDTYRKAQGKKYLAAKSSEAKKVILREATEHLLQTLRQDVFPAWYGTVWDFNGTSAQPGEGSIACGYFVSTTLNQVGFKVNRFKLAQQPSQKIIETFVSKEDRKVLAGGKPMKAIREYLKGKGDGLYIVGLDRHVGFVSVLGDDMAFIHSSYYKPDAVVKSESIDSKNPLSDSQYRVFGKLLSEQMVADWLQGREYTVSTQ